MIKQKIHSTSFAKKMGAYSHAYKIDIGNAEMIFTTGQIAVDNNGNVVFENDVSRQTEFIFESINKILHQAGSNIDDIVKVTIFVTDINDFDKISPVRNKYLAKAEAVSTLVEVSKLVKDGCKIEIEAIAVKEK